MRRLRLARDLGFWDSVLLGVGFIVGSGVYLMPVLAAQQAGSWSIVAWIIAGLFTIITGLCFADLAVKIPRAGGLYAYAHKVLGNFWGFVTGYSFWMGYWITIAVETIALALYLSFFTPLSFNIRVAISLFIAIVFTVINYKGVRFGGEAEDLLTIGKLIPLAILVLVGLSFFNTNQFSQGFSPPEAPPDALGGILASIVLVLWAYQGVEIITVPEEEIRNARKTVPRAIIVSVLSVMALYLLVAFVVLGSVDWHAYVNSESPLADISVKLFGGWGGVLLAFGGLVSILGALNAVILASARISFAMSRDGFFPKFFSHLHPEHRTPDYALVAQLAFASLLILFYRDFVFLASLVVLFTLIPWLLSCAAAWKLQYDSANHSVLTKNSIIPGLATLSTLAITLYLLPQYWLFTLATLGIGMIYYFFKTRIGRKRRIRLGKPLPPKSPFRPVAEASPNAK